MAAGEFGNRACRKCAVEPSLKESWQCEAAQEPVYMICPGDPIFETPLYRCPLREVTNNTARILDLYWHWKDGRFPVSGGVLEQAYTFLEATRFLDTAFDLAGIKQWPKTRQHSK